MDSPAVAVAAAALPQRPSRDDTLDGILQRVGRGDQGAFSDLYDRVGPALVALLARKVHRADVEEHLSNALVVIWQAAPRFDPARQTARTWITHTFSDYLASIHHRLP